MTLYFDAIVVGPNPIFREGLVRVLTDEGYQRCCGIGSLAESEQMWAGAESDLIVVDLDFDDIAAADLIKSIKMRFARARVVALSNSVEEARVIDALQAGADGYLLKQTSCKALAKFLELVALGERVIPAQALEALCAASASQREHRQNCGEQLKLLSNREVEILSCLCAGSPNKIIARQFGISEATVKVHVKAILRKIQAKNRTEAAIRAASYLLDRALVRVEQASSIPSPAERVKAPF